METCRAVLHGSEYFYAATRLQAEAQAKDSMTTMLSLSAAVSLLVAASR